MLAANSGIWTAAVVSQIALAPLAGILYAALGPGPAFGINAASFMLSAVLLAGLRLPAAPNRTQRRGFLADAAAGLRLLLADRLLRILGVGQLLAALSAGATSALLVVLARDHLDLDPSGYGLLLGAIGVGAVLGPFLLTRLVSAPRRPLFVFGPFVLRGVVDIALAIFTALPVALVALAVYGLGTSSGAVTFNSLLQAHIPEHTRGRIFASFDAVATRKADLPPARRAPRGLARHPIRLLPRRHAAASGRQHRMVGPALLPPHGVMTKQALLPQWHLRPICATIVAMSTESLRAVRDHLSEVVDRVEHQHERVILTRNGHAAAVLISPADLAQLEETLDVLSDPAALADIREADAAYARGEVLRGVDALNRLRA